MCLHEAFSLKLISHRLFTGTTSQDCATACPVSSWPFATGVSQLRYRLQLCASTRRFHSNSYHTFYGHHPGLCNCPVNSWPFATWGISVEISATTTLPPRGVSISQVEISATTCSPSTSTTMCLHEFTHSYHTFYGHHPGWCNCHVSSWPFATVGPLPQGYLSGDISYNYAASVRCFHILV